MACSIVRTKVLSGWRGELRREGAKPSLKQEKIVH
jgi:hypothetical protein